MSPQIEGDPAVVNGDIRMVVDLLGNLGHSIDEFDPPEEGGEPVRLGDRFPGPLPTGEV